MRRFEFKDAKSSKFWEVVVKGKTLNVTFGKIGTKGQSKPKYFATPEKAKAEMEKLIKEKTGKGYVEVRGKAGSKKESKVKVENKVKQLTKAEKKDKAGKVLQYFSTGDWHLGRTILESSYQETWLYEELLKGTTIENGEIKPSPVIKKYFAKLTDGYGYSLDNSEMVVLAVLAEAPVSAVKKCKLETKKIRKASCKLAESNLDYCVYLFERFASIKNWNIAPTRRLFESASISDIKLLERGVAFLCKSRPDLYKSVPEALNFPGLKILSGNAAKSITDLLKKEWTSIRLPDIEKITDEAMKEIILSGIDYTCEYYYPEDAFCIPRQIEEMIDKYLKTFISSAGGAEELSNQKGDLFLNSLTSLTDSEAEALSKHKGGDLYLNGLKNLSDLAAKALSRHKGDLYLDGVTTLSDTGAKALSRHKGDLYLNGLASLCDSPGHVALAVKLACQNGDEINLCSLASLGAAAAGALSKREGALCLDGLESLSDAAAEALSKHKGYLGLSDSIKQKVEKYKNLGGKK